jgi:hypothetical protein
LSAENAVRGFDRICGKFADNLRQIAMMILTNAATARHRQGLRGEADAAASRRTG